MPHDTTPNLSTPIVSVTVDLALDSPVSETWRHGGYQTGPDEYEETFTPEPYTLQEAIVDRCARLLMDRFTTEEARNLRNLVSDVTRSTIAARVVPMVDEAIANPVITTNMYGERKGETTLTELVIAEARKALTTSTDRYAEKSPLAAAIAQTTKEVITKELAAELAAAKVKIRNAVQKVSGEALAAAIAREVGA